MTTSSPDAHPTPPPADESPARQPAAPGSDHHASQFPQAEDDFGLAPKPKADQQAKAQRVDPLLGMDLGGVQIVRLLGEGGMGRVYEAQQHSPQRTVAVKVIRAGITSEKTMRRFEREAEFLGKLQHPGIAQIYVVGSYASDIGDVPFFVMEYIANAKPITNYVHEQGLTVRDTLGLFKHICDAICHGHDRGIVHRDLKPGNILIDSEGKPKVIDFGVARSTDSDLNLTSMRTDTGALVGTVQYMSPEQFGDSTAEGLDGRADVYALGVVLYELLAGVLPYSVRRKKMHEAARIVCEFIPPTLRSREKSIPRDVSLIAERCLQKDRRGRYQSAGELAGDIQRVLDGQPIRRSYRGWLSRVRERLRSHYGRWGLLGLVAAACVAFFFVGRALQSGNGTKGAAGPAATPIEPVREVPPPPIMGRWVGPSEFGGETEGLFRDDGVYVERGPNERICIGRLEAVPDGVRVTLRDAPPVTGWFVNGGLHLPPLGIPPIRSDVLVLERQADIPRTGRTSPRPRPRPAAPAPDVAESARGPVQATPANPHDELWALVDENLAAMTAHDLQRTLATMSREMPQKDLFVKQSEKEWEKAGMHYRLDALEVVKRDDWPPPYAVARVTLTIRDPTPDAPGDKLPPDELSHVMLLRTKVPTTCSEWLFKRESDGWKIVANLTPPEPAAVPDPPEGNQP